MKTKMKSSTIIFIVIIIPISTMMFAITITSLLCSVAESMIIEENNYRPDLDAFDEEILEDFFDDEYDDDDHNKGRVFYSHSMMMYGTQAETIEKELIRQRFNDFTIISPKVYEGNLEKERDAMTKAYEGNLEKKLDEMEFYKMIVSGCQMLVYSKWKGEVTSGVLLEVNHAIDMGIPVFELVGKEFIPQKGHIEGLSYEETTKRYFEYLSSK